MRDLLILAAGATRLLCAQAALPTEWIDPDTGHRVIRLSREDGTQSLYFNQNAYTADGKKLIVSTAGAASRPSSWRRAKSNRWSQVRCPFW